MSSILYLSRPVPFFSLPFLLLPGIGRTTGTFDRMPEKEEKNLFNTGHLLTQIFRLRTKVKLSKIN